MPLKDKAARRDYSREYMRKFRESKRDQARAIAAEVASLVEGASKGAYVAPVDPESLDGLTHRAARGVLEVLLNEYGLTPRRILAKLSEVIDATRLRATANGEVQPQPCHDIQLKAVMFATKLLQMTGTLPPSRQIEPSAPISIHIVNFNSDGSVESKPFAAAKVITTPAVPVRNDRLGAKSLPTCSTSRGEARISANQPYEPSMDVAEPSAEPSLESPETNEKQ